MFKPFRRYKWIHQSKRQAEIISEIGTGGAGSLPTQIQNKLFLVIEGWGTLPAKGLTVQANTKDNKLLRMPGEWYKSVLSSAPLCADPSLCLPTASIPRFWAENAPAPSWWDLKQAIRKSWIFCEQKLNPPRASLFSYTHTCSSPRTHAKCT